jgi:hypothetical protein
MIVEADLSPPPLQLRQPECKSLLCRMLVTTPSYRATLSEVMSHPWMTKGFEGPPDAYLVHREPLRVDELDPRVMEMMQGFEFGTHEEIELRLRGVLLGEDYRRALSSWERRRETGRLGAPTPSSSTWKGSMGKAGSTSSLGGMSESSDAPISPARKASKRFSGFSFKTLFSSSPKEEKTHGQAFPNGSSGANGVVSGLTGIGSMQDAAKEALDPTRGFHPLISIYYLCREKMERDRVYGPGHFATSDLSLQPPPVDENKGVLTPSNRASTAPDYTVPLPRLPAPASAMASSSSRTATPSLDLNSPRSVAHPRQRAAGDELGLGEPSPIMKHPQADEATSKLAVPSSPTINLPRSPVAATHRRSQSLSQPPAHSRPLSDAMSSIPSSASAHQTSFSPRPTSSFEPASRPVQAPFTPPPREAPLLALPTTAEADEDTPIQPESPSQGIPRSQSAAPSFARRFGSFLGRNDDDSQSKRNSLSLPRSFSRPTSPEIQRDDAAPEQPLQPEGPRLPSSLPTSQSAPMPGTASHKRAATVLESKRMPERRTSLSGSVVRAATSASSRRASGQTRPASIAVAAGGNVASALGGPSDGGDRNVLGRTDEEVQSNGSGDRDEELVDETEPDFKPVYMKGLFSVATTSTRSASALSKDIIRVLDRTGIRYRAIKGGYECAHTPSIDLSSVVPPTKEGGAAMGTGAGGNTFESGDASVGGSSAKRGDLGLGIGSGIGSVRKPSIKRKSSKLSLAFSSKGKDDKSTTNAATITPPTPSVPLPAASLPDSPSLAASTVAANPSISGVQIVQSPAASPAQSRIMQPASASVGPGGGGLAGGAARDEDVDAWLFDSNGAKLNEMIVRFEIMIVKVRRFPLSLSSPSVRHNR